MKDITKSDWDEFCTFVKHKSRYFFHYQKLKETPQLYYQSVVEETANELCNSLYTINTGTTLYRCRPKPGEFATTDYSKELGPPPIEYARANRMSPAGISMFYLAESRKTALLETADKSANFGIAEFEVQRDIYLIDLTDFTSIKDTKFVRFLNDMVSDMTKPIERDDRVHVEYIPTQIFTELITYDWSDTNGRKIEGLRFPSSRNPRTSSYVLFYDQEKFLSEGSPFKLSKYYEEFFDISCSID